MEPVDLAADADDPALLALLAAAFGSAESAAAARERFTRREWRVVGYRSEREIVAFVGLEAVSSSAARVRGVAVAPLHRGRGLGRSLLRDAAGLLSLRELDAETDADAAGFYAACGFEVSSLGERYPGVERFACVLTLGGA